MRKLLTITLLLLSLSISASEKSTSFSISSGMEYLDNVFFNFGASIIKPLSENKEFDFKVALNMKTKEKADGSITPLFNVPIKVGINFLFPINEKFTFLAGTGVSPLIRLAGDDKGLLIGPNAKAGLRYKIHPSMSVFIEACQSLLIGAPKWMYPSTEAVLGVNFFL